MSTSTISARPSPRQPQQPPAPKPAEARWGWGQRPRAGRGYLQINSVMYQVDEHEFEHESGWDGRLWDLTKADGTTYRVVLDREDVLTCDCPDATYRPHREHCCKHCTALREAYQWLEDQQARETAAAEYPAGVEPPF
jgi:hypothetical protein